MTKIRKSTIYIFGIISLVLVGYIVFAQSSEGGVNVAGGKISPSQTQLVKLSVSGGNYILSPSVIKKGIPVKLVADSSVVGCARSIIIPEFNVRDIISSSDREIEFTPDKAGTFTIACSMYMYTGTFEVLNEDETKSGYIEQTQSDYSSGGSCGVGGGGCGCGGF